jgi:CO dehydrogenase nickel-insertion accessory protein CooC1
VFLPLLELENDGAVVMDEKAGADGASTGIVTGVDVGVIVVEPSVHSIKTSNQIAELMDFFATPYVFVGNKVTGTDDQKFLENELSDKPVVHIPNEPGVKRNPFAYQNDWHPTLEKLFSELKKRKNNDRLSRTIEKFSRNASFSG